MATYKEHYLAGEIEFEEIDKYSYQWGMRHGSLLRASFQLTFLTTML